MLDKVTVMILLILTTKPWHTELQNLTRKMFSVACIVYTKYVVCADVCRSVPTLAMID